MFVVVCTCTLYVYVYYVHVHVCTCTCMMEVTVYGVFSSALFCVTIYVAVDVVIAVSVLSSCMW